jgi:hypothetical protein
MDNRFGEIEIYEKKNKSGELVCIKNLYVKNIEEMKALREEI